MGLCALRFWYIPPDGQSCYSPESCVYDHVFSDYNTRVRPATDPEEVIQINASVTATSLTGIVSIMQHVRIAIHVGSYKHLRLAAVGR